MKIITVNVNGIRAAEKKGFFEWLKKEDADVVCLQEIKAQEDQLDERFYPKEYHCYYHPAEKKGYSGTAIFSKKKPNSVIKKTDWADMDFEGRIIQADFDDLSIISMYIHSGSSKQERQDLKMEFLTQRFMPYLKQLKADNKKVILCGDVNIVHQKRDIKNFNGNKKRSGCLPEERAYLDELFNEIGFVDAFREINQEEEQYTWWSNRGQAWANNTGWRIDYQILTPNLKGTVKSAQIYKDERFSDHAPLTMDYQCMNNSIVSKYIDKIAKKTGDNSYIYRGQSQNYDGDVTSTALRRFHKSGRANPSKEEYFEYHKNLINDAKSYHYGEKLNDTELLIDLQHYGAATGLIDFSEDFLVALWFACNNTDKDGKVFFLNVWSNETKYKHLESGSNLFKEKKNYKENLYYLHTNFKNNNRIFAQKGVFIFGYKDINTDLESITINKDDKPGIRQELKKYFNIEEKTLFQDIYGFAQVNNTEHKINIQSALDYFEKAYEEENSKKQINLYQKAIEIEPDYYWAHNNMGNAHNKLEQYQEAIDAYKKAIEINPDEYAAYYNMGIAYNKLEQYQEAIDAYKKAIEINPDEYAAYYNMGIAYNELGRHQEVIDAYKKAIEIKPDEDRAYNNMGIAYGKLGQYQEAIDAYKKAIEIKPDKDEAYYNMGIAHDELGQHQEAIDAYKKAIEIKPDKDEAYTNLFELRLTQGQEFDQKLINSFKENCKNNQGAMMKFNMLNIFKTIDASHAPDNWQNEFKNKHQGVTFGSFSWKEIRKWIDTKPDKQVLQAALTFFETFN